MRYGEPARNRTSNLWVWNPLLCRLSYWNADESFWWWARHESNVRVPVGEPHLQCGGIGLSPTGPQKEQGWKWSGQQGSNLPASAWKAWCRLRLPARN